MAKTLFAKRIGALTMLGGLVLLPAAADENAARPPPDLDHPGH
jgi:hypothetical protein